MLEEYFDFFAPDDIRLKGSRVGIESVLYEYIHRRQPPEAIQQTFPTLSLAQVYATILYYLQNKSHLDAYLADWLEFSRQARAAQRENPPPAIVRLQELKKEIAASGLTVSQYLKQQRADRAAQEELVAT